MAKEYAKKFYHSKEWQRTRHSYIISRGGLCERCGAGAKLVHHKTHITPANISQPSVTLNHANLELLCQDCHNLEHNSKHITTARGLTFNNNGELIPLQTPTTQGF
jgi:5-methylcytosine-specific restriction endonuclease McrA